MAVEFAPIEVAGLKEALKELNTIDKKLRRKVTTDFKKIIKPVLDDAREMIPNDAPLSGMARSWKPGTSKKEIMNWMPELVDKNLKAFTSGKKARNTPFGFVQNLAVFGIRWAGPQATLFDLARKGSLGRNLTNRYGHSSRIIWRAYELNKNEVEGEVKDLAADVMRQVGRGGRI